MRRWAAPSRCGVAAAASAAVWLSTSAEAVYGTCFTITPRAWQRIAAKNAEDGVVDNAQRHLRLAIESGGCHGYLYKFAFEPHNMYNPEEDVRITAADVADAHTATTSSSSNSNCDGASDKNTDKSTDEAGDTPAAPSTAGCAVVVDEHTTRKLLHAVLDYHSELKGSAFVVVGNELLDQSCACAMSFSLKRRPGAQARGRGGGGAAVVSDAAAAATTQQTDDKVRSGDVVVDDTSASSSRGSKATALRR